MSIWGRARKNELYGDALYYTSILFDSEYTILHGWQSMFKLSTTEVDPAGKGPASPIYMEVGDVIRSNSKANDDSGEVTPKTHCYEEPTAENPFYHTLEKIHGLNDIEEYDRLNEARQPDKSSVFDKELDVWKYMIL